MDDDELARVALHEAGHSVVAWACGCEVGSATVKGGTRFAGCASLTIPTFAYEPFDISDPFVLWPGPVRQRLEREVLTSLAGEAAEYVLLPFTGPARRTPEPLIVQAAEAAAELPPPDEAELARLTAVVNDEERKSDRDHVAEIARLAHGSDFLTVSAWLDYMEQEARALVLGHQLRIRRLAGLLAECGTLSGEAVATLVRERPQR